MLDAARFLAAQGGSFADAKRELEAGRKRSHWMWFVFPQLAALGRSATAKFYGIGTLADAREYARHPVLGARLVEVTGIVLGHRGRSAHEIFGTPDDLKFRSSMTLFAEAVPEQEVFRQAIGVFYDGPDALTLELLGGERG